MTPGTKQGVSVVRFEDRHLEDTLEFLATWSPEHPQLSDRQLFEWQRCERWLAVSQDRIVGHIAQIPHVLRASGRKITICWGAALVIDMTNPQIRESAKAVLLDQVTKRASVPFAAAGVVPDLADNLRQRGYTVHDEAVSMYARFFRPSAALAYYQKSPLLSLPVHIINLMRPTLKRGRRKGQSRAIDAFDPVWDKTWRKLLAERTEIFGDRTAEYLNYKIGQPGKDYMCRLHETMHGAIDGYVIYRRAVHHAKDLRLVKIVDLVGTKPAKRALVSEAVQYARTADVDGIVGLGTAADRHIFSQCGLWARKPVSVVLPSELSGTIHLAFFDSDLDHFW